MQLTMYSPLVILQAFQVLGCNHGNLHKAITVSDFPTFFCVFFGVLEYRLYFFFCHDESLFYSFIAQCLCRTVAFSLGVKAIKLEFI
jgi:hypothetical protein